jgi:UDP-N-acetylmuramoyl-tripeptide--D-alanyl-D-alanine ligase
MTQNDHSFYAAQIAEACGGRILAGDPSAMASGISTDTRNLRPSDAFFALVGRRHDGHEFLTQAAVCGAPVLVVEQLSPGQILTGRTTVVQVQDTARALLALAGWHARRLRARLVAVTGSYGKTTVKEMIGAILPQHARRTVAPSSFNNRIGVALTLLAASPADEYVVLEMGTNHPGEIDELAKAARPHVGVITAISEAHLEGLGSLDGVREAKGELIPHLRRDGALVLNADDRLCMSLAGRFDGPVLTFGHSPQATVSPCNVLPRGRGWAFEALGHEFHLHVGGQYNVLNASAALCAVQALGAPLDGAAEALRRFHLPPMRYERRQMDGVSFILDCYNSNPPAVRASVESLLAEPCSGAKVVVCGEMLELGPHSPALHYDLGRHLADVGVDMLVGIGPMCLHMIEGWRAIRNEGRIALHFPSARAAWQPLWRLLQPGDCVLVKGSRRMRMEVLTASIASYLAQVRREVA